MNKKQWEWQRLAAHLESEHDAILLTSTPDQQWLSGFPAEDALVVVMSGRAAFFTDSRYIEAAERDVTMMEVVLFRRQSEAVHDWLKEAGARRLFVQTRHISLASFAAWKKVLPEVEVLAHPAVDEWLTDLRAVKTPEQLEFMRQAQKLTDDGFAYILERIEAGRTERDVALDLEFFIRRAGAEGVAFDFIAVAGENGSLPHGVPGERVIRRGDFVTMDFGARVNGWRADMTRTVAVGEVADWQREIYDTVLKAQENCLRSIRAGMTSAAADALTRDVIEAAGYGAYFGHGTGHGVGLEVHEAPSVSPRGGDYVLRAGEVVTVEPGIYLPGRGGVRIEDMVVLTADGCENFTKSPKNLIIL